MPKLVPVFCAAVCVAGASALVYFAQSYASQSLPAYSTLNTKPNGAKLMFDALSDAGFVQVSRQFKSIELQKPKNAGVFFLGAEPGEVEERETSARAGNRLVFSSRTNGVPEKAWQPLPDFGPGVWRRGFGKGDIILVANPERLTNKGIATESANRGLLRKLLAGYHAAVFEEAHLGIRETGSIAGLARHYHLQGLIAGLLLLAALFIWSRSVSFPPLPQVPAEPLTGVDNRAMLAELMSRHLMGQLLTTCVAEWNRTRSHAPAIQAPDAASAVAGYAALQESLQQKTKFRI